MEIRIFSELVNKSRIAEECVRKAVEAKNDRRESHRREHNQEYPTRGQEFKRRGYPQHFPQRRNDLATSEESQRNRLNALAIAKHEGSQNDEVFRVPKPRTISIAAYAEDEDKSESIVIKDESGLNGSASKDRQANTRYRKSTNESSQAENFVTKDHDGDSHGTRLKEHRGSNDIVGGDVFKAVRSFFHSGKILKSFNHTQICLILKVPDASDMTQVRPISLSSVMYKIISKVMMHRLQGIMNKIISPNQSAFLKGRLISDNILIAHECMHYLKNKRSRAEHEMAIKLDMSKAYDRVEWHFLWYIMDKLGFDTKWIN
ncbi:uncharacterized protein [Arachis hypogaea]|uniref:uncharacterized protein n=1 Tax=Arachis hypogaea TaxID=3818 RepID=UPI000DECD7BC|nr:uncharacterized protein LOC112726820 [Arachis hypogaea]